MEKGVYYLLVKDRPLLYLFTKLSKEKLSHALPLTKYDRDKCGYLSAFFEDGVDFLGADSWETIEKNLNDHLHINLLENSYEKCCEVFPNI